MSINRCRGCQNKMSSVSETGNERIMALNHQFLNPVTYLWFAQLNAEHDADEYMIMY